LRPEIWFRALPFKFGHHLPDIDRCAEMPFARRIRGFILSVTHIFSDFFWGVSRQVRFTSQKVCVRLRLLCLAKQKWLSLHYHYHWVSVPNTHKNQQ
jgi:hypothetical protein